MKKLFDDFGEYIPGFFKMTISKELFEGITWGDFSEEEVATLIHEYVHFLQDISTTRGINNFIYVSKILRLNFAQAYKCGETIYLPLDIQETAGEDAYEESELQSFYSGNNGHFRIHHVNKICREEEKFFAEEFKEEPMYAINVYYDNEDAPYIFGSDCIAESMAYIIEHEVFGAKERKNEFPYNLCEIICEELYPNILGEKAILVAMCELSLMHYHSGDMFWHILIEMKKKKLNFQSVAEFEDYFIRRSYFLFEDYVKNINETVDCIDFLYPTSFKELEIANNRMKDFLKKGQQERLAKRIFIAKLLESHKPINMVNYWMNYFGTPLICDTSFNVYASDNISCILAPLVLYNFFSSRNSNKCDMIPFCKAQHIKNYNPLVCENNPWEQINNKEFCPFGFYWYKYSLEGKSVFRK